MLLVVNTNEKTSVHPSTAHFIGALRDYERGGMADFYFYSKIPQTLKESQHLRTSAEEKFETESLEGFEFFSDRLDVHAKLRESISKSGWEQFCPKLMTRQIRLFLRAFC